MPAAHAGSPEVDYPVEEASGIPGWDGDLLAPPHQKVPKRTLRRPRHLAGTPGRRCSVTLRDRRARLKSWMEVHLPDKDCVDAGCAFGLHCPSLTERRRSKWRINLR